MEMSRKFVTTGLRPSGPASWGSATVSVAPVGVSPTESESDVVRPVLNVFRTSLMFEGCNPPIQASGRAGLSQPSAPKAHRAHSDPFGTRPCQISHSCSPWHSTRWNQMSHSEIFDNLLSLNDPVEPALQTSRQGHGKLASGNAPGNPSQSSPAPRQAPAGRNLCRIANPNQFKAP